MVSQIIISHEDSTSFFSIGSVQDDASLVSALGGALASFAIEMGLSDTGTTQANYSRFQNGILISKWLEIDNHRPSLMIALRGFENIAQYQQMFLIDYGTLITKKIITTYEKMYVGDGEIPKFDEAIKLLPSIAHELQKDSPSTLKEFKSKIDESSSKLLDDIWENQDDKGLHPFKFRSQSYSVSKLEQIKDEFTNYFYREGTNQDALFPLGFAGSSDMSQVKKFANGYLKRKSNSSRTEISNEITKIVNQLQLMSSLRSKRGKQVIETVDLINADVIFEKLSVAKITTVDKIRSKILNELYATLLQKLYQKYPLKFLSNSNNPIDLNFISKSFEKSVQSLLNSSFSDSVRITKQFATILRDTTADFTPEEAINQREKILKEVEKRYIRKVIQEDPFIIIADSQLKRLKKVANKFAKESFQQYRTAHDEAMALWYIIRQINTSIAKMKSTTITNQMKIHLLQELVRKYQFRTVPKIIYDLTKGILINLVSSSSTKDPINSLIQRNLNTFENESAIRIPDEIKKIIFRKLKVVKVSKSFENIEELSYFSRAFTLSLESTIVKILELFFGTKNYPQPPELLSDSIEAIILSSQSLYSLARVIQAIISQSGAKGLFRKETVNILQSTKKFKSVIPSPLELARIALEKGWMVESTNVKREYSKITDGQLLAKIITIPKLELSGRISSLVKDPIIVIELYVLFTEIALMNRYSALKVELNNQKKRLRTANSPSGKKKIANRIKKIKTIMRSFEQILSGGNFIQKLFLRKKDLPKIVSDAAKERYPKLNYYPDNFKIDGENSMVFGENITVNMDPMFGSYQKLLEVFASTWVKDSEYIKKLKEEILWRILEKNSKNQPLERKIIGNLQQAAQQGERVDQETIVRTTIEQEVSLMFNKAIRESISLAFNSIKDDLIVKIDLRTREFYISIETIDLDKQYLQSVFDKLAYTKYMKKADDKTEIRLNISELLPLISSRKKKNQAIRAFLRDGIKENLRSRHLKSLNALGELIELYIGDQAGDLFFKKSRILEQLVLESID